MDDDPVDTDWSTRSVELASLMAHVGLGDRAAFERLYARTSAHLFAVVRRIQHDRAAAEEVLQEVYVSVWQQAGRYDAARSQPLTWLTHVARHRAIDSLRRAAARPAAAAPSDDDADPLAAIADEAPGPLALLDRASDARALGHCMQRLSAAQRQSVALAFYDGLSHAEVAERLREPLGTVKSWVRRALASLKQCLQRAAATDGAAVRG